MICRRVEGGRPKIDKNGGTYWVYNLQEANRAVEFPKIPHLPTSKCERASSDELHLVYSRMLSFLVLTPNHHRSLLRRGISDEEIAIRLYRSAPAEKWKVASALVRDFGEALCVKVPGIVRRQGKRGPYWSLGTGSGLLIPVRDVFGKIVALKVRSDPGSPGSRYYYFASAPNGPSPGAPVHTPLFQGNLTEVIRLTEGELKSDIATIHTGILTISIPGTGNWKPAIPVLQYLKATTVRLAFDKDSWTNRNVARDLQKIFQELQKNNFLVEVETWT